MGQDVRIENALRAALAPYDTDQAPYIVAVSGGQDSVALLHALHGVTKHQVIVAHYDHGLRVASRADARWVCEYARLLGYRCVIGRMTGLRPRGSSVEEHARTQRYAFFARVMRRFGARIVVTAHTANDQAETVLMHLVRGSGVRGIAGMQEVRGAIVRPLLALPRHAITSYVAMHALTYREDATNQDIRFTRNYIRHQVMPTLSHMNPDIVATLTAFSGRMRGVHDFLITQADAWQRAHAVNGVWDRVAYRAAHPVVQTTLLQQLIEQYYPDTSDYSAADLARMRALLVAGRTGAKTALGSQYWLSVSRSQIFISPRHMDTAALVTLRIPGSARWQGRRIIAAKGGAILYTTDIAVLDTRTFSGDTLHIRTWHPGDRFVPSGSHITKKLSDYFTDTHIPRIARNHIPVITTTQDDIVWIAGYRVSDIFRATAHTPPEHYLQLTIQ